MRARQHYERSALVELAANEYETNGTVFPDWEIVFRFYRAVHLIEAYFAGKTPPVVGSVAHRDRERKMRELPELSVKRNLMVAYKGLKDRSEQVRYDPQFRARKSDVEEARANLRTVVSVLDAKVKRQNEGA